MVCKCVCLVWMTYVVQMWVGCVWGVHGLMYVMCAVECVSLCVWLHIAYLLCVVCGGDRRQGEGMGGATEPGVRAKSGSRGL